MAKQKLTLEWMHRFENVGPGGSGYGYGTIRVWAKRTSEDEAECREQHQQLYECLAGPSVMGRMLKLPFVTAVEHLDGNGNGKIVYVDWP
jgi:hypothetical protein